MCLLHITHYILLLPLILEPHHQLPLLKPPKLLKYKLLLLKIRYHRHHLSRNQLPTTIILHQLLQHYLVQIPLQRLKLQILLLRILVKHLPQIVNLLITVQQTIVIRAYYVRYRTVHLVHRLLLSPLTKFIKIHIPTICLMFHVTTLLPSLHQTAIRSMNQATHYSTDLFNLFPDDLVHDGTCNIGFGGPLITDEFKHFQISQLPILEVNLMNPVRQQLMQPIPRLVLRNGLFLKRLFIQLLHFMNKYNHLLRQHCRHLILFILLY